MRFLRSALTAALLAGVAAACGGDGGGGGTGIFGTWRASQQDPGTEFVFDNNAGTTFDAVTDGPAPGTVTLQVRSNGTYSLVITVSGIVGFQQTGTFVADTSAHTITITETGQPPVLLDYILTGNTLSIATQNFGDVQYDFDGDTVNEPADLFATFTRR